MDISRELEEMLNGEEDPAQLFELQRQLGRLLSDSRCELI